MWVAECDVSKYQKAFNGDCLHVNWTERYEMACNNFIETVSVVIDETMEASIKNLKIFKCAFEEEAEKLHKCVCETMEGQLAIKFLKEIHNLEKSVT